MSNIVYQNGYPFVEMNGELIAPCMFRSFRPTPANISLFHRAGVRLHQMMVGGEICGMDVPYSLFGGVWKDDGVYDFAAFDRQFEMFERFAPGDYFVVFLQLDAPPAWVEKHEGAVPTFLNVQTMARHEEFRRGAAAYLKAFIAYSEEHYGDRIAGYGICCGRSCEWFASGNYGVPFLQKVYAGHTGRDEPVPVIDRAADGEPIFRTPDSPALDFMRFMEDGIADLARFFAHEVQTVLAHRKFLGLFGGYHTHRDSGALTNRFCSVWDSPDIDMVWAPASYDKFRELANASAVTVPLGSVKLHGKVHLNELDHRTELAWYPMEHPVTEKRRAYRMLPGNFINDCAADHETAHMVFRRELASSLQAGSALWWFDFFGGYYASPEYEAMLKQHTEIYNKVARSAGETESRAEIAVIVNTPSNSLIRDGKGHPCDFVVNNILTLAKCGAPYTVFNLCDFEKIDHARYKLWLFLNDFEMTTAQIERIRTLLADRTKLWLYAPGIVTDGKMAAENIGRVTGIPVEAFDTKEKEPVTVGGETFSFTNPVTPMYAPVERNVEVIGRYRSGKAAFAWKGNDLYAACGCLSASFFRELARKAGVRIYAECDGALYINSKFVSFETVQTEDITLDLGFDCVCEELFDGGELRTVGGKLTYHAEKGRTKLFLFR